MKEHLTFNEFKIEYIEECTKLMIDVYSREPWYDKWPSFEKAKTYLMEYVNNPVFRGFVLKYNEKVVAVCFGHKKSWWQGDEYYINEFYTDYSLQNKGLGTKLMNFVKESLKEDKIECITLLTEHETPAEKFYEKNGFMKKEENIFMFKVL